MKQVHVNVMGLGYGALRHIQQYFNVTSYLNHVKVFRRMYSELISIFTANLEFETVFKIALFQLLVLILGL